MFIKVTAIPPIQYALPTPSLVPIQNIRRIFRGVHHNDWDDIEITFPVTVIVMNNHDTLLVSDTLEDIITQNNSIAVQPENKA